jgi:hypothetical protein
MDVLCEFVNYGTDIEPQPGTVVLDVGMKTVPGVIDHHHPSAEPECTASLIVKHPRLVLEHVRPHQAGGPAAGQESLRVITHRLPDFDSIASIYLTVRLLETSRVDQGMETIAAYTKMVDSASLPRELDLAATPYSILRALFSGPRKDEAVVNRERVAEGLKLMHFLHEKSQEGYEILENRRLFSGIDRYARAMRKVEDDYFHYLDDVTRGQKPGLRLPLSDGPGWKDVDGLIIRNPTCFLLKEWARRDTGRSSLGGGFGLTMTNFGNQRYIIGVDPMKGVHLKGLGSLLNMAEARRREGAGKPFLFPWYEGNCPFFNYRIIDSPQDGTLLDHQDVVHELLEFSAASPPP